MTLKEGNAAKKTFCTVSWISANFQKSPKLWRSTRQPNPLTGEGWRAGTRGKPNPLTGEGVLRKHAAAAQSSSRPQGAEINGVNTGCCPIPSESGDQCRKHAQNACLQHSSPLPEGIDLQPRVCGIHTHRIDLRSLRGGGGVACSRVFTAFIPAP